MNIKIKNDSGSENIETNKYLNIDAGNIAVVDICNDVTAMKASENLCCWNCALKQLDSDKKFIKIKKGKTAIEHIFNKKFESCIHYEENLYE